MALPMTKLLQKKIYVNFVWYDKCQQNFHLLKSILTEASVLTQPKSGKEFIVYSNASLNDDLELVAIVFELKILRHYLYGKKCHAYIDQKSLK
ncbi:polyprotein [Gossypium australe]|uniref:Polyprotein n=1 Tax=Gossypium australe TaxID=47621 RepID=A0A5B6X1J6_9ROSI|nr:polyprotein [Gossypium australe]